MAILVKNHSRISDKHLCFLFSGFEFCVLPDPDNYIKDVSSKLVYNLFQQFCTQNVYMSGFH